MSELNASKLVRGLASYDDQMVSNVITDTFEKEAAKEDSIGKMQAENAANAAEMQAAELEVLALTAESTGADAQAAAESSAEAIDTLGDAAAVMGLSPV